MKPPSKAQLWARERNWNKARLTGVLGVLRNMAGQRSTTSGEKMDYEFVGRFLVGRLNNWDEANKISKEQYLKRVY